MFITKKHIPRRTFLQGAGVTLALPLLESMVPASTVLAQTAAAPTPRFVGMFFPHGMAPGYWEPKEEGKLPEKLPYILEGLEKYKDQTTVMTGLWSQSAEPPEGTTGSDHWVAAAYLTGIKPRQRKQAFHNLRQPCDLVEHAADALLQFRRSIRLFEHQLQFATHDGQRRAQFVRRVGEEAAVVLKRSIEPGNHLVQRDGEPLQFVTGLRHRQPSAQIVQS